MTRIPRSFLFVLTAAVIVGAGAARAFVAQTTAAVGLVDACTLLTKEDAAAALGESVTGPQSTPARSMGGMTASACEYSGSGLHKVHLNLMKMAADQAAIYTALCAKKGHEGLTGLGDTSCWYNDKHGELQVLKGLTFFSIVLQRSGDPTEPIKAVAKKVYDRLK